MTAPTNSLPAPTFLMTKAQALAILMGAPGAPTDQGSKRLANQVYYGVGGYDQAARAAIQATANVWPTMPQYAPPPSQSSAWLNNLPANPLAYNQLTMRAYYTYLWMLDQINNTVYSNYLALYAELETQFNVQGQVVVPPPPPHYEIGADFITYISLYSVPLPAPADQSIPGGAEPGPTLITATLANQFDYVAAATAKQLANSTAAATQPALGDLLNQGLQSTKG